jgi:hypothetical protein
VLAGECSKGEGLSHSRPWSAGLASLAGVSDGPQGDSPDVLLTHLFVVRHACSVSACQMIDRMDGYLSIYIAAIVDGGGQKGNAVNKLRWS